MALVSFTFCAYDECMQLRSLYLVRGVTIWGSYVGFDDTTLDTVNVSSFQTFTFFMCKMVWNYDFNFKVML